MKYRVKEHHIAPVVLASVVFLVAVGWVQQSAKLNQLARARHNEEIKYVQDQVRSEKGFAPRVCSLTVTGLYFQPGINLSQQMNAIGQRVPDWAIASPEWVVLVDENRQVVGAVSNQGMVQADKTPIDSGEVCRSGKLQQQ